ncbi:hypothetical protein AWJ20_1516 [Sugiyamaella lignohabitans]|uniref:PX domain-containing protein n=1 Tax=Sugiyamaella lignohabitans TaxID=796027 RepID=A0A167DSC6_9ASCO|nr:uncharacterized protein AWJ20_1516 [Sugiyamaella lignohabitans]ANB13234.1 hypothetical protein AWJ20_1516 [Sugiyamaella lignohabitans]
MPSPPEDADISNLAADADDSVFSIVHEHYLKRELIRLQIDHEVAKLNDFKNIGQLGPPFLQHNDPNHQKHATAGRRRRSSSKSSAKRPRSSMGRLSLDATVEDDHLTPEERFPIFRHFLAHRIKTFPFLGTADDVEFWQKKVQPFIESFAEKDISSTADREEATKRKRMGVKITKLIQLYTVSGVHTTRREEHDVKVQTISQRGIQEVDGAEVAEKAAKVDKFINGYRINIEGVRKVTTRKGFFSDTSYQYIIQANMEGAPPVHVARSYSEFKELDRKLHKEFPGREVPQLPAKNRVSSLYGGGGNLDSNGSISKATGSNKGVGLGDDDDLDLDEDDDDFFETESVSSANSSSSNVNSAKKKKIKTPLSTLLARAKLAPSQSPSEVPREKQRIVLRAYLHKLVEIPKVTKSAAFLEFLFKDRIRDLTAAEKADIEIRKQMDAIRVEEQLRFLEVAKERAKMLEGYITEFKQELIKKDGLANIFRELKMYRRVEDMSPKFQKFIEWVVIELAATLYHIFVAQDSSPEFFSQVRRLHSLMPYSVLKGILRVSNPVAVMKGLTDLFLAQPFGKRSLMQNLMLVVLADDMKAQDKLANEIRSKMAYPELCDVFEEYVDAEPEVHNYVQKLSQETGTDLIMQIYRVSGDSFGSPLPHDQLQTVEGWYKDWTLKRKEQRDGKETTGNPFDDSSEADSYEQLKELYSIIVRKRDKDMMQLFWEDSITVQFLKELITVFYGPLIQVFRSAKIYESVGDFEKFMSDLVRTVHKAEAEALSADPNQTVQQFIDLCKRHQNMVIRFINEVYINDNGLFDGILLWMSDIIEFLRNGPIQPLDLVGLIERAAEEGEISVDALAAEMDAIQDWIRARREWRDRRVKLEQQATNDSQSSTVWDAALPSGGLMDGSAFGLAEVSVIFLWSTDNWTVFSDYNL